MKRHSFLNMTKRRDLTAEERLMAARIAAAIKSLPDMTQDRLGEIVGVTQGQVSHWTGGRLPVPALKAAKVAKALHIDDPAEISTEYREIVGSHSSVRSQPARLDPDRIAETAKALRVHYERMGKVFNIEDEPALFVQVYRMCEELLDDRTPDNLIEFGSWLQRAAPERVEGQGDERGARMSTPGVTGRASAKGRRKET